MQAFTINWPTLERELRASGKSEEQVKSVKDELDSLPEDRKVGFALREFKLALAKNGGKHTKLNTIQGTK